MSHLKPPQSNQFYKDYGAIEFWLKKNNIEQYEIVRSRDFSDGYEVNVDGDVTLDNKSIISATFQKALPVKFNRVTGSFSLYQNSLTTLVGSPRFVGYDYICSMNGLTSLEGSPETILGNFSCTHNELVSLDGGPLQVGGDYNCAYNKLTSLRGAPSVIENFKCQNNKLSSFEFCPSTITGGFTCFRNPITDFSFMPKKKQLVFLSFYTMEEQFKLKLNDNSELEYIYAIHASHKAIKEAKEALEASILPISPIEINTRPRALKI